MKKLSKNFGV